MLMKKLAVTVIVLMAATVARAQIVGSNNGAYLGPGVLSRGAGTIGQRGGQIASLRFAGGLLGFYDTGILPISTNQDGRITQVGGLFGIEATLQAYGVHQWKRSTLGLDYQGNYRHYSAGAFYNGSDQRLILGYSFQPSRRVIYDFRGMAGTIMRANNGLGGVYGTFLPSDIFNPATGNIFDSRADFLQAGLHLSYIKSVRTSFTVGGEGYAVYRRNKALVGVNGYTLRGSVQHRMSLATTLSVHYEHMHYDYPRAFGESDIDMYTGMWARSVGRFWSISVQGGVFRAQTQGIERISLDPAVAALLGVSTGVRAFLSDTIVPTGTVTVSRTGRRNMFTIRAARTVYPGNGVYLTSRTEEGYFAYSYSGIKKWTFSIGGSGGRYNAIGQSLKPYTVLTAYAGASYALTRSFHLTSQYDRRHQDIDDPAAVFKRDSGRFSFGVRFSPGELPLALW